MMPKWAWKRGTRLAAAVCCLLGVLGWSMLVQGSMDDERDVVAERQELMKNTGGNFKDMRLKAKAGQFDRMAINAQNIAINARHIPMLFPEGSMGTPEQKSRAKPEIWQKWSEFTTSAKDVHDAAMKIVDLTKNADKKETMVSQADVDQALKDLGEACKSCHKEFRKPKKKKQAG
jgi:cytochrome c556